MSDAKRKGALRALAWVLTLLAIVYLVRAVVRDWRALDLSLLRVRPLELLVSVALETAALAWGVSAWGRLIRTLTGTPVRLRTLLRVWWSASVARFVPGKVWPFVAAAGGSATTGVSGPLLAATFGLHAALALITAGVVGVAALERTQGQLAGVALSVIALVIVLIGIHPRLARGTVRLAERMLGREPREWRYRWRDGAALVAIHVTSWLVQGVALFLFVRAIVGIAPSALSQTVSATALSFAGGSLLSIAPAGIGVREAALAVMLEPYVPAGTATVVALAARLWSVAAEALLGAIALMMAKESLRTPTIDEVKQ
ncbi:MAG TPA: lysylphosphatidylglycerol synthase domain-containing protein [Gemmatimonadaceae bacterium]|nr:lysylphosphatidylglycerol synthase domain-containing protein [Gemmatimonadaceae bacterium]